MIKLQKIDKPQILIDNATTWTNEYLSYIDADKEPPNNVAHHYNHEEIKSTLEKETFGKCAYCESKLKHIEYGDIEHILPKNKSARPDLYVDWNNLTLSCEVCNRTNKKDYYDKKLPLINPYIDNPIDHFLFLGPILSSRPNNQRAFTTELTLGLNRNELVVKRNERISSINILFYTWENEKNQTIKNVLAQELINECAADKEYSAFVKAFLVSKGFFQQTTPNVI